MRVLLCINFLGILRFLTVGYATLVLLLIKGDGSTLFLSFRASRKTLPPGVGVVTQFHAWWHIFTGLGSYLHILLRSVTGVG